MSCETTRNRLIALPDPRRLPAGLRGHVAGCSGCAALADRLATLDRALAVLPVPAYDPAVKATFLAGFEDAGPIITRIPTVPRRDSVVSLLALLDRGRWRYAAGLAAGIAVAVGGVWWADRPPAAPHPEVAVRHDLLGKEVRHLVALTRTNDPRARLTELVGVAESLNAEARQMYLIAGADEMADLQRLFDKAVARGVVPQAERLPEQMPRADRAAALAAAQAALAAAEAEAGGLAGRAPVHTRPMLERMAASAKAARERLGALITRDGGA
jgi:hypothetical protein